MSIGEQFLRDSLEWAEWNPVMVDIQNIEEMVERQGMPPNLKDLPSLPPWPRTLCFFMERLKGWEKEKEPCRVGIISECLKTEDGHKIAAQVGIRFLGSAFKHLLTAYWDVDREGKRGEVRMQLPHAENGKFNERAEDIGARFLIPALVAFAFCHCKNVSIEKVPVSRQIRRRAERTGEPTYEHHTIAIEPMRKILVKEGGLAEHGDVIKAMHICRGHFARYGEKFGTGKLFGKYEGQFWMPQHVRGKLERGVITKDYKIKA